MDDKCFSVSVVELADRLHRQRIRMAVDRSVQPARPMSARETAASVTYREGAPEGGGGARRVQRSAPMARDRAALLGVDGKGRRDDSPDVEAHLPGSRE